MKKVEDEMMTIPIQATMREQPDGSMKMVDAVYAQISANAFAEFLIKGFGLTPILREDATEEVGV